MQQYKTRNLFNHWEFALREKAGFSIVTQITSYNCIRTSQRPSSRPVYFDTFVFIRRDLESYRGLNLFQLGVKNNQVRVNDNYHLWRGILNIEEFSNEELHALKSILKALQIAIKLLIDIFEIFLYTLKLYSTGSLTYLT